MSSGIITLSLLDRLIDDAPDSPTERIDEAAAEWLLKQGIRRDLEGLLNAKKPHSGWAERPELAGTVLAFGVPDLSTDDFGSPVVRERIRRLIVATIRAHEPRLRRVEVESDGGPTSSGVRFRISATMFVEHGEETVIYDARLRPSDREFAVQIGH
jgi:type VI secretion system protein ImpF